MGIAIIKKSNCRPETGTVSREIRPVKDTRRCHVGDKAGNSIYGLQYSGERLKFDLLAFPKRSHGRLMMILS